MRNDIAKTLRVFFKLPKLKKKTKSCSKSFGLQISL